MRTLGRRPKRRMQSKGTAEIAENNKKNVGEDPELEEFLDALPKEPTSSLLEALQTQGRRPKRRMQPVFVKSRACTPSSCKGTLRQTFSLARIAWLAESQAEERRE